MGRREIEMYGEERVALESENDLHAGKNGDG
jgi:hypothetical protein